MVRLNRRLFLASLSVGALACPRPGDTQQPAKVWRVGVLSLGWSANDMQPYISAIEDRLRDLGYAPNTNVVMDVRFASGDRERLPELARQLVEAPADMIIAVSNQEIAAGKQVTTTVPIIMVFGVDPVDAGFVASFARPGGNITGTTYEVTADIASKWIDLLKQLVPRAKRMGLLWDPSLPGTEPYQKVAAATAARVG